MRISHAHQEFANMAPLDDHVRIGGRYFDVIDTAYTIGEIPIGSSLRVVMHYRVSTNFNWYVRPIAAFLVTNFENTALAFYAHRAESGSISKVADQRSLSRSK
jgi:hypothetical protein